MDICNAYLNAFATPQKYINKDEEQLTLEGRTMAVCNLTELIGKDVFTRNAKFVGKIDDTMIDTEKGNLYGVAVGLTKDSFLSKALTNPDAGLRKTILIPYKEIISCEDIVLVTVPKQYERPEDVATPTDEAEEIILPGVGGSEEI